MTSHIYWPLLTFISAAAGAFLGTQLAGSVNTGRQFTRYVDELRIPLHPAWWTPSGEVELGTTTTPDALPIDGTLQLDKPDGPTYRITRHQDLGAFQDLQGHSHQQWRVWGKLVSGDT